MKIVNIHTRHIHQPKVKIAELFRTLSSENDMMLATDKWSPMLLDHGLKIGSKGGHGPIKYFVYDYQPDDFIQFQFTLAGFHGFHKFEITDLGNNLTELRHTIDMHTSGSATLKWVLAIRWLHDAYMEDAFDKVENHFTTHKKSSEWSVGVKFLRKIFKPKRSKNIRTTC